MKKDIYDIARKNITRIRKEKGLSQLQLAELANLSHDYIRQIESTKIKKNFSLETLYDISIALNVSIENLLKEQD